MNKKEIKILIGNKKSEYEIKVASELNKHGYHAFTRNSESEEIFDSIINEKPDIVVVDFSISGLNAISLLQRIKAVGMEIPEFIITSTSKNDYIESLASENGAAYFVINPDNVENIVSIIMLVARKLLSARQTDLMEMVTEIIRSFGIPAHLNGYAYLRSAIILAVENMDLQRNYIKGLYPSVAEKYMTTSVKVERSIRNALDKGWNNENKPESEIDDPNIVIMKNQKPTNSEFIANVADSLRIRYKKYSEEEKN